jgi:hypothetical protein
MKLYTEEQVKNAIQITVMDKPFTYAEVLEKLTPIELPSDEEIEDEAKEWWAPSPFRGGVQWIIRQIKQQENGK